MQDQAPAIAGEPSTEGPHHELTEDYERSDGQFLSVTLAGIAAGQPGSTGLGLANEGGITIDMSNRQASWQDRPYQQEVTMTNPPSWGYDLAGGEAARFIELPGQMASREQARIEQDEAEQALRSLGMTRSAENRLQAALGRIADGAYLPSGPAAWGLANDVPGRPRRGGAVQGVLLACRGARRAGMRAAARGIGFTWEHLAHLYLKRSRRTRSRSAPPDAHRAALASLVNLPPP